MPYVTDTFELLQSALKENKKILMEGAQAVLLDLDFSAYPYTTASNVVAGVVNAGAGIPVQNIGSVMGIVKAYTSKVGSGPFPSELIGKEADSIREKGKEYGTTTGRPRRVGWLDLESVKFACTVSGITEIAITKIDILSGLKEIKICTGYKYKGKSISYSSCGYEELFNLTPIYKTLPGWTENIDGATNLKDLPKNCQEYIKFIKNFLGIKISIVSTGPQREEYIQL